MSGSGSGCRTTNSSSGGVQQPQFNSFGSVGNSIGQGSFVGRSDNTGRFVGQTQAGQQSTQGNAGSEMGGGGSRNAGGNGNNNGGMAGNAANQQQAQRRVRPQLKVAFAVAAVPMASVETTLRQRLSNDTLTSGSQQSVDLSMDDGGIVTLRGEVTSPDAKSLAVALVRLEPGVRKVVNELTIAQ